MSTKETTRRAPGELAALAERANRELAEAPPLEVIRWARDTFGERLAVTSSMADGVVAHLASRAAPGVDVLFLDTGYHFAETIGTRDAVAAVYDVNVITLTPELSVAEQDAAEGKDLFARDPDRCCALRKVAPLNRALRDYDAWITGLRRDEAPTRGNTPVVGFDERRGIVKIAPIARWSQADVDAYVAEHGVLVNPLIYDGYDSIGCAPCTRRTAPGENARDGRWAGFAKTECGLHR
jgi:phosphoadenosine phosphosulfate reductase